MNKTVDRRYYEDPAFHALVDQMRAFLAQAEFTPSEVREAIMLAQLQYEMEHPRRTYFSEELLREIEFRSDQFLERKRRNGL